MGRAPGQGDPLGARLQARALPTACLLPSLCRRLRPAPSPPLSRAVLVISPLQFQLHHLSVGSPGAPADRVSTFPQLQAGLWGAAPCRASGEQLPVRLRPSRRPVSRGDPGWVPLACPPWLLWVPGLHLTHSRSRQADTHRAAEMAPAFKRQDPGVWDLRSVSLDSRWLEVKKPHTWTVQVEGWGQKALRQGCGGCS